VLHNGKQASKKDDLRRGDIIEVSGLHLLTREIKLQPQDIPFEILYQMSISLRLTSLPVLLYIPKTATGMVRW
jgi:hypothetical protein